MAFFLFVRLFVCLLDKLVVIVVIIIVAVITLCLLLKLFLVTTRKSVHIKCIMVGVPNWINLIAFN